MSKKSPGRPAGAANVQETTVVHPARCPRCDSTEKTVLGSLADQAFAGTADGRPYTHIVRRRVRCTTPHCGQVRIERTYENRPAPAESAKK
jgi:hypothetical protein